jgi:hypothetical protein
LAVSFAKKPVCSVITPIPKMMGRGPDPHLALAALPVHISRRPDAFYEILQLR